MPRGQEASGRAEGQPTPCSPDTELPMSVRLGALPYKVPKEVRANISGRKPCPLSPNGCHSMSHAGVFHHLSSCPLYQFLQENQALESGLGGVGSGTVALF